MSREIRRVPANWEHPKMMRCHDAKGDRCVKVCTCFKAMHKGGVEAYRERYKEWETDLKEWNEGWELWQSGKFKDYKGEISSIDEVVAENIKWIVDERNKYNYSISYRDEEEAYYRAGRVFFTDFNGEPPLIPNPDDYMPEGEWYQVFETVSEGTPTTPAFETTEELVQWMANNKDYWGAQWTEEGARRLVQDEWAPSMIVADGKVYRAEETYKVAS